MVMPADIGDGEASTQDLANDAIQLNALIMQTTVQIPQSETRSGFANFGPEENFMGGGFDRGNAFVRVFDSEPSGNRSFVQAFNGDTTPQGLIALQYVWTYRCRNPLSPTKIFLISSQCLIYA
jgi:hypothetical protein